MNFHCDLGLSICASPFIPRILVRQLTLSGALVTLRLFFTEIRVGECYGDFSTNDIKRPSLCKN